ncbi:zinc finger protein [Aspergillus homomorphus CBS 101889]|uniref:DUF3669 domain-containing protein n=1 Tax=Aspergillus homomorphus (strain CBS 101889) TaxID=1450537 RepID=A0A395IAY1_ASPHC|nr:hypothetical protein BO97DRAFT_447793 [Aspergillus homomorphus CBS 101889]RAL17410.1 hypothetical protein BO97DRAFT_447793 [Aspergillus homomorphus CBS 101889]
MINHRNSQQSYHRIGAGFCGTVWARSLDGPAIKREDGGPSRSLANDYLMHKRAFDAFLSLSNIKRDHENRCLQPQVRIPQCHAFITPKDMAWWADNLQLFPPGYSACNATIAERIPPFPKATRALLVGKYCPPETGQQILSSPSNEACLIRPYVGRKRTFGTALNVRSRFRGFSLRNFPLHVDQMIELGISSAHIDYYAAMMGEALATLHWLGQVDGNDIEFVLAPPPTGSDEANNVTNVLGLHTMWVLDFDLCRPITADLEGVIQAVDAFFKNDPFFPRPNTPHWMAFQRRYLQTAALISSSFVKSEKQDGLYLGKQFIELVEARQ